MFSNYYYPIKSGEFCPKNDTPKRWRWAPLRATPSVRDSRAKPNRNKKQKLEGCHLFAPRSRCKILLIDCFPVPCAFEAAREKLNMPHREGALPENPKGRRFGGRNLKITRKSSQIGFNQKRKSYLHLSECVCIKCVRRRRLLRFLFCFACFCVQLFSALDFKACFALLFFYFCFCSTPTTKRKDSPIDVLTLSVQLYNIFCPADFLFVLFVYISLTRNSHNGDEFVCIFVSFFFVFHDVGYTQKIKKDERDFISFFFAGYIYTRFALFSGSTTHKQSLGLCLCFFFFC